MDQQTSKNSKTVKSDDMLFPSEKTINENSSFFNIISDLIKNNWLSVIAVITSYFVIIIMLVVTGFEVPIIHQYLVVIDLILILLLLIYRIIIVGSKSFARVYEEQHSDLLAKFNPYSEDTNSKEETNNL